MGIGQAVCRPVVVLAIGLSLLLSGCARTSQSELDKAKAAGASEEAAKQSASAEKDAQAKLAAEIQKLKAQLDAKTGTVTPSTVTASVPVPVPVAPQGTSCGSNVSAGPNTTCPFALNVAAEYLTEGGGTISIVVYSPVTGLDYTMSCVAGVPSICRGGNNAVVYIR